MNGPRRGRESRKSGPHARIKHWPPPNSTYMGKVGAPLKTETLAEAGARIARARIAAERRAQKSPE